MKDEIPNFKVPIKKYIMDETLSWEERYQKLEAHHLQETTWLIQEVVRLRKDLERARAYKGLEAHPCPLCYYEGGYFKKHCEMHKQIDELRKRLENESPST